jgi:arsenate reductase (thioredoxin)
MAEGILRHLAGDRFDVFSAGTDPKGLHPQTIVAMKEIGIDVTGQRSRDVREFSGEQFDFVITVCDRAKQQCPIFPGAGPIHWSFEDPADAPPEKLPQAFARVRDEIFQKMRLWEFR